MDIFAGGALFCPSGDASLDKVVRKGLPKELALKARSEGQRGATRVKSQKRFSGRGSSMCKDPGAGKSLVYQEAEGLGLPWWCSG